MHPRRDALLGLLLATALIPAGGCRSTPDGTLVAAAMSLRHALVDLGEAYRERNPGVQLQFHFAASGVLLRQASEGAPFDVIALAGEEEMDRLQEARAIDPSTRTVFASNRLLLAVPAEGPSPAALEGLTDPGYARIALGSPATVPAGRYARQVLERTGLWDPLQPRLLFTGHVRQVVEYLERSEVDAGFLYASDAEEVPWLRVALEIDESLHEPIRYPAAILRDAPDRAGAQRFIQLLEGNLGQVILRRHGFGPGTGRP